MSTSSFGNSDFERTLEEALALFEDDKLFQAARKFKALRADVDAFLKRSDVPAEEKVSVQRLKDQFTKDPRISQMDARSKECTDLLYECDSSEQWECTYNGESTKVWYKKEGNSGIHSVRTEGVLNADFVKLASLIYETDLYSHFWWFVRSMDTIQKVGRCSKAVHGIYQAFWPIHDREVPILGYAVDGFDEDDCLLLFFRNLRADDQGLGDKPIPIPLQPDRTVRVDMKIAGMRFIPIAKQATKVTFICNVDPKLKTVPTPLINWATRSIFRFSLRILETKANELHKLPHMERMETDEFYTWFRSRLEDYFQRQGSGFEKEYSGRTSFDAKQEKQTKPPKFALLGLK